MTLLGISKEVRRFRPVSALSETFGLSTVVASVVSLFIMGICLLAVVWVVRSAPPRTLTISSGRPGSTFQRHAEAYQRILATHGVTLRILSSEGSKENLQRLVDAGSGVDIAFVQGGLTEGVDLSRLVSLGSISYKPLWVFYRSATPINRLSALEGKRIAIGDERSGTHVLALALLKANGITGAPTTLLDLDAEDAAKGLSDGSVDALFLMGDSAPMQTLRALIRSPDVRVYNFTQADAYVRRNVYLNKIALPEGSIDLGKNLPAHDLVLVGPTVELVARVGLNSALSDLLLGVARRFTGNRVSFTAAANSLPRWNMSLRSVMTLSVTTNRARVSCTVRLIRSGSPICSIGCWWRLSRWCCCSSRRFVFSRARTNGGFSCGFIGVTGGCCALSKMRRVHCPPSRGRNCWAGSMRSRKSSTTSMCPRRLATGFMDCKGICSSCVKG